MIPDNRRHMKKSSRATLLAVLAVFLMTPTVSAEAVPLTDQQIQTIKTNCVSAQTSIKQLQRTEAVTRVNRGRAYESLSSLFVALNSRVAVNKLNAPALTSATAEMERRFTAFKTDYSAYEDALSNTTELACANQPVTFYDSLTNARELRARVAADIKAINEMIDAYQNGVNELRQTIQGNEP